jgi:hypothetical protein
MLPYATITESADRRWTFRLLDRLDNLFVQSAVANTPRRS